MGDHRLRDVSVGIVRSFTGPSDLVPLWGNILLLCRFTVGLVPGLWRNRPWRLHVDGLPLVSKVL